MTLSRSRGHQNCTEYAYNSLAALCQKGWEGGCLREQQGNMAMQNRCRREKDVHNIRNKTNWWSRSTTNSFCHNANDSTEYKCGRVLSKFLLSMVARSVNAAIAKSNCYYTPIHVILFCMYNRPRGIFSLWGVMCVMKVNAVDLIVYHYRSDSLPLHCNVWYWGPIDLQSKSACCSNWINLRTNKYWILWKDNSVCDINAMNVDRSDVWYNASRQQLDRKKEHDKDGTTIGNVHAIYDREIMMW